MELALIIEAKIRPRLALINSQAIIRLENDLYNN